MPEEEKRSTQQTERIYTINLSKSFLSPRKNRAPRAVKILKEQLARHFKVDPSNIRLSNALNAKIFSHSIEKPPKKIKVRGILKEGKLFTYLFEEDINKSQRPQKPKDKTQQKTQEVENITKNQPQSQAPPQQVQTQPKTENKTKEGEKSS